MSTLKKSVRPGLRHWCLNTHPKEIGACVKWALRTRRVETQIEDNGVKLWLDPISPLADALAQGKYEEKLEEWLRSTLDSTGTFLDVGANEGYFSMFAATTLKAARVICVEPNSALWPVILRNVQLNRSSTCTLAPFAIGDFSGSANFVVQPSTNSGASSLCTRPSRLDRFRERRSVPVVTLDWLIESTGLKEVSAIKVDVEGFEEKVIAGARESLKRGIIKSIAIEMHNTSDRTLEQAVEDIRKMMAEAGYTERPSDNFRWIYFDRPGTK